MAGGAGSAFPRGQHLVRRLDDVVVAVAGHAGRHPQIGERLLVRALVKELGGGGVTVAADIRHGIDPWRSGAVVAMTTTARRSGEITLFGQHLVMDASLILLQLIGGNLVVFHVARVTMAPAARLGHLDRIGPGRLILDGTDGVHVMTTDADGNLLVSLEELLPVDAGQVLLHLVCPNGRIEFPHVAGIAVALPAELWDLLSLRLAQEPFRAAVALLLAGGGVIAAMAVVAGHPPRQVEIVTDLQGRPAQALLFQRLVTIDARMHRHCRGDV